MTNKLAPFEGRDVIAATIAITNAGDGLSQAMAIDPKEMHHGDTVYVVLECEVVKIRHDEVKETDALTRVHVLKAGVGTIVDAEVVTEVIEWQRRLNEQAKGIQTLDFDGEVVDGDFPDATVPPLPGDDDWMPVAAEILDADEEED
jgi:hypothetical protein